MKINEIPLGLSFDDVLLVPQFSEIKSRSHISTRSHLAGDLFLNVPIISSNMDSVTMHEMAIAMSKLGGIGFIHRFLSIEEQCDEIMKVKRYRSHIIEDPYTIQEDALIEEAQKMIKIFKVGGLLIAKNGQLHGILTERDIYGADPASKVSEIMTPRDKMVVGDFHINIKEAEKMMHSLRVEKLPLVNDDNQITGLIVMKDIKKLTSNPLSSLDKSGKLLVGASVGVVKDYLDRAEASLEAGADLLVIDVAHGHIKHVYDAVKEIKARFKETPLIAGNVATAEGIQYLRQAGVDAIRVGIGCGSSCVTRLVAGAGVPQLTAILECGLMANKLGIPIIADGGIRAGSADMPGGADLAKAIGAGASTVMLGSALAACQESPGKVEERNGRLVKTYRGMASIDANISKNRKEGAVGEDLLKVEKYYVAEGITATIPYKNESAADVVYKLIGGLRSGMSYSNAQTIPDFHRNAKFIRQTQAGIGESKPHILDR